MYVGRIVAVGRTAAGANAALYRVSSRSFPNRKAIELGGHLAIVPREGHEKDLQKSPYIAYNCLRVLGECAIVSNGSQTDPIAEKIQTGMPIRDVLAGVLGALDYERDRYGTPRIAGIVPLAGDTAWLAIVRADALLVKAIPLEAGRAHYVTTYEANEISDAQSCDFDAIDAPDAARFVVDRGVFSTFELPVTSAAALAERNRFALATWIS